MGSPACCAKLRLPCRTQHRRPSRCLKAVGLLSQLYLTPVPGALIDCEVESLIAPSLGCYAPRRSSRSPPDIETRIAPAASAR